MNYLNSGRILLLSLIAGISSVGAKADEDTQIMVPSTQACYETLTANHLEDSHAELVYMDDLYHSDHQQEMTWAAKSAERMLTKLGCDITWIPANTSLSKCTRLSFAHVCEVHSDAGYFVVVKDMVDSGQVIFNRYD